MEHHGKLEEEREKRKRKLTNEPLNEFAEKDIKPNEFHIEKETIVDHDKKHLGD